MLAVADNDAIKHTLTGSGLSKVVQRFIAGETLDDAVAVARNLRGSKIESALDFLGENVTTAHQAQEATDAYIPHFRRSGSIPSACPVRQRQADRAGPGPGG